MEEGSLKAKKEPKELKREEEEEEVKEEKKELEEVKEDLEDFKDFDVEMCVPSEPMASAVLLGPFSASQRDAQLVMANFDCPEPCYVAPPSIEADTSELPV